MKIKFHPVILGAFVLGAIALAVAALVFLGTIRVFSRPQFFACYFHQSVSGLEKGSPVKIQGVRVGRVESLNVIWNLPSREMMVAVICEVDRQVVRDENRKSIDITDPRLLQSLIENGLRAKLNLETPTGLRFISLDFVEAPLQPLRPLAPWEVRGTAYPAIPTVESQ